MGNTPFLYHLRITLSVIIILCLLYPSLTTSQVAIVPWGGDAIGEAGSVSYSLGQVADEHYSSESGYCNEGVQQPFTPDSTTANFDATSDGNFSIYPNPFRQELILYANDLLEFELQYSIMDLTGRLQTSGIIHALPQSIHLPLWPEGMYIMILRKDQIIIDAIKLIKAE